jgi:hypothetical protein
MLLENFMKSNWYQKQKNNLVAACRKCNATKSNKLHSEWKKK